MLPDTSAPEAQASAREPLAPEFIFLRAVPFPLVPTSVVHRMEPRFADVIVTTRPQVPPVQLVPDAVPITEAQ
jgi:hypothetical protein